MVAIVADGWGLGGCVCDLECDGHDCGCECAVEVDEALSSNSERAEYYVHGSISSGPELWIITMDIVLLDRTRPLLTLYVY